MSEYLGISENRLHHMLAVGRKAYQIAKEMEQSEDFCRRMFVLGFNHDIGYEFSKSRWEHAQLGADMLASLGVTNSYTLACVSKHGTIPPDETLSWRILNMADMLIDYKGDEVTAEQRLQGLREHYGGISEQYLQSLELCKHLGLIEED